MGLKLAKRRPLSTDAVLRFYSRNCFGFLCFWSMISSRLRDISIFAEREKYRNCRPEGRQLYRTARAPYIDRARPRPHFAPFCGSIAATVSVFAFCLFSRRAAVFVARHIILPKAKHHRPRAVGIMGQRPASLRVRARVFLRSQRPFLSVYYAILRVYREYFKKLENYPKKVLTKRWSGCIIGA